MKPTLTRKSKPVIARKRQLTETAVLFRIRAHCQKNDLLHVQRTRCRIGPVFLLSLRTGRVIEKRLPSLAALAHKLNLIREGEQA